jgi:hypothetical protein
MYLGIGVMYLTKNALDDPEQDKTVSSIPYLLRSILGIATIRCNVGAGSLVYIIAIC